VDVGCDQVFHCFPSLKLASDTGGGEKAAARRLHQVAAIKHDFFSFESEMPNPTAKFHSLLRSVMALVVLFRAVIVIHTFHVAHPLHGA
jgi:hypothetical protein